MLICESWVDISQMTQLFLSSFLGFLSALLVEWISGYIHRRNNARQLEDEIKKELKEIYDTVNHLEKETGYISPYRISVWNLSIQTGEILGLSKKFYYNMMIHLFNQVEEANRIESECYKMLTEIDLRGNKEIKKDNIAIDKIFTLQNKIRKDLSDELEKLMKEWR